MGRAFGYWLREGFFRSGLRFDSAWGGMGLWPRAVGFAGKSSFLHATAGSNSVKRCETMSVLI
jgi:hypothetical protein